MRILKRILPVLLSTVILIGLLFPIIVYATAITIGSEAINRNSTLGSNYTLVNKAATANAAGTITSVEIWSDGDLTNCWVGTFYVVSGNNLSSRDTESIGGVTGGSKRTFAVSLTVEVGDMIGLRAATGNTEYSDSGGSGVWIYLDYQIECTNKTFTPIAGTFSIYGTGTTPGTSPTVTTQAADTISFTTATTNGNVTNLNGGGNATIEGFGYDVHTHNGDNLYAYDQHSHGDFGTGAFHEHLTGLIPDTTYYFKPYATNPAGTGWGSELTFKTSNNIETDAATGVAYTDATLNAELLDMAADASYVVSFDYGKTVGYEIGNVVADESPMAGTGTYHTDLAGLDDGQIYYFRAKGVGDVTGTRYGSQLNFTTDDQSPTVTTQAASVVTMDKDGTTGGTFNGNLTNLGDSPSAYLSFQYGLTDEYGHETSPQYVEATGIFSDSIPIDLIPGETYNYRSKATNNPDPVPTGTTYYVAKTGNNGNDGTLGSPWLTISYALTTISAGDAIIVRTGTYNERCTLSTTGTLADNIFLKTYPGETVIIDGTGLGSQVGLILLNDSIDYYTIDGFEIRNAETNTAGVSSSWDGHNDNITLKNLHIHDTDGSGIHFGAGASAEPTNITIDACEINNTNANNDQEAISLVRTNGFEVKNCYVYDIEPIGAPREGIDCKVGTSNGSIHDNKVSGTVTGIYIDCYGANISNIDIYNNEICGNTQGISASDELGTAVMTDVAFYNNLVYDNDRGFTTGNENGTEDLTFSIINNTFYNNGLWDEVFIPGTSYAYIVNCIIRNNIFYGTTNSKYSIRFDHATAGHLTVDHNLFYNSGGTFNASSVVGTDTVTSDPSFVNIVASDFRLQNASPAQDTGSATDAPITDYDDSSRPADGGYDLGAFELNGVSVVTPSRTAYGSNQTFTFTMPTFTTVTATITSPGPTTAQLNGNISNMQKASDVYAYFIWGYDSGCMEGSTSPQVLSGTGNFHDHITGFLRNVTVYYKAVLENHPALSTGSAQTYLIVPPALAEVLWYQPNDYIRTTVLPDRDLTEDGIITWGTNVPGVTGTPGPFGSGLTGGDEAKAPRWALDVGGSLITPTPSGEFRTDVDPTFPGAGIWKALADATNTPVQLPLMLVSGFIIIVLSLSSSWSMRRFGSGSLVIKGAVILGLMGLLTAVKLYDWWMIVSFGIMALALSLMSQQRGTT